MSLPNLGDPDYPVARTFGLSLLRLGHLPPSWFLTTLTTYSASKSVGLLRPTADHGVHRILLACYLPESHPEGCSPCRPLARSARCL